MVARSGCALVDEDALGAIRALLAVATVATPNTYEALFSLEAAYSYVRFENP